MTWGSPFAFAGLALLAIPIAIHLLGLGRVKVRPFPSLRFLERARLLPARRTRIHDAGLLALRLLAITLGVVALARPGWRDGVVSAAGNGFARAIIVDTGASMLRASPAGGRAVDVARGTADTLARSADAAIVIATDAVADAIGGASAWLQSRARQRELVVVSDFQVGTLTDIDLAQVPAATAVRVVRIPVRRTDAPVSRRLAQGGREFEVRAAISDRATQATWEPVRARPADDTSQIRVLAGPGEESRARIAAAAALTVGRPARGDVEQGRITIVYPRYADRTRRIAGAVPVHETWHGRVIRRLSLDSSLIAAAQSVRVASPEAVEEGGVVVARSGAGDPIILAFATDSASDAGLLLDVRADPASNLSVALFSALARADVPPAVELDPAVLSDAEVARFERSASPDSARDQAPSVQVSADTGSPARWLWLLALAVLGVEALYRRSLGRRKIEAGMPNVAR